MATVEEREAAISELKAEIEAEQDGLPHPNRGRYGQHFHLQTWPDLPDAVPPQARENIGFLSPDPETSVTEYKSEDGIGYVIIATAQDEDGNKVRRVEHVRGPETHRQQDEWREVTDTI